jgi:hypothetical protein
MPFSNPANPSNPSNPPYILKFWFEPPDPRRDHEPNSYLLTSRFHQEGYEHKAYAEALVISEEEYIRAEAAQKARHSSQLGYMNEAGQFMAWPGAEGAMIERMEVLVKRAAIRMATQGFFTGLPTLTPKPPKPHGWPGR